MEWNLRTKRLLSGSQVNNVQVAIAGPSLSLLGRRKSQFGGVGRYGNRAGVLAYGIILTLVGKRRISCDRYSSMVRSRRYASKRDHFSILREAGEDLCGVRESRLVVLSLEKGVLTIVGDHQIKKRVTHQQRGFRQPWEVTPTALLVFGCRFLPWQRQ
jgi:hypothetical protein